MVFQWDDRHGKPFGPLPHKVEWQWETWIAELADYVEFRGSGMLRPENKDRVIDRIGLATREAGIPFIFQSVRGRGVMHFDGPFPSLAREIAWARQHPDITGYNLYELADFSRMTAAGEFEGSPDMAQLVCRAWSGEMKDEQPRAAQG